MTNAAESGGGLEGGRTLVIGIGNPDCGDDGVGPLVARLLARRALPGIAVWQRSGNMLGLIEDWAGYDSVVLVDAAAPAGEPGAIHCVDLLRDALPAEPPRASTHAFGVVEAVRLGGALNLLPARLIAYAVEGMAFGPGTVMSPVVAAAAERVVEVLEGRLADPSA